MKTSTNTNNEDDVAIRFVIALNNIGVTLLGKHCYGQALDTLRDAVSIVHTTVRVTTDATDCERDSASLLAEFAAEKHHAAISRLLNPRRCKRMVSLVEPVYLVDENAMFESPCSKLPPLGNPIKFYPIRMEGIVELTNSICTTSTTIEGTQKSQTCLSESESFAPLAMPDLEASVVLHNLGIAFVCMSLVSSISSQYMNPMNQRNRTSSLKYQMTAVQMLRSSHTLYMKSLSGKSNRKASASSMSPSYQPELLNGMTVLLNSLIQALMLSSLHDEANYYQSILTEVQGRMNGMKAISQRLGLISTTASAA